MPILEIDKNGTVTAAYETKTEAAEANGITLPSVRYSIAHNGNIVKKIGKGFIADGDVPDTLPPEDKSNCGACAFGQTNTAGEINCGYLLITGKRRPCRGVDCEIWKNAPRGKKRRSACIFDD